MTNAPGLVLTQVELTPDQARYLSVIAAQDMRKDQENGLTGCAERHYSAWLALHDACRWDES